METLLLIPETHDVTTDKQLLLAKAREVELLSAASRTLNASLEFGELLGGLLKIVKSSMRAEAVLVSVIDETGTRLIFERAASADDKDVRGTPIAKGAGVMGWVWEKREPLVLNDPKEGKKPRGEISLAIEKKLGLKVQSLVAIPLMRRGTVRGVLEVVNRKNDEPYTEDDVTLLIPLGEHVAVAVANARLRAEANRRRLEYSLLAEVSADVGKSLARDEALDRILKNLKKLVDYDAAAIFLIDRRTDSITSVLHTGYPRNATERIHVKMDEGLVGVVAKTKTGILVPDVRNHPSYHNLRARTRSELVAPMLLRGNVQGLFNLENDRLDAYSENDLRLLEAFAAQASVAIERAQLYEERRVKLEIEEELRIARTVQEFFSPRKSLVTGSVRVAGANFPSLEVSGDYYDFFPSMNRLITFAIADVAGKGVPASLLMATFRALLRTVAPFTATARQIAIRANQILLDTVRPGDFVTAFIGVLDPDTGEVSYCNAGHNPPVLMSPDGSYRLLGVGGPILGILKDAEWTEGRFRITDEVLVCYTDGATEARNVADEEYGEERFIQSVRANLPLMPYRLCTALYASVRAFSGAAKHGDDTTYLAIRRVDKAVPLAD
jgi:serine phosphatase RsbU (regulator of sigma subunit)